MKHRRLQELDRSDFEIIDGEPDIRGWDVKISSGQKIGEVEELILDAQQKKVRYMVVDMDDNELDLKHRKVLMPIGLAQLHGDDDDVIVPGVTKEQMLDLPPYDKNHLTPEIERRICSSLGRKTEPDRKTRNEEMEMDPEFYRHDYFNADNLYKNRMHEAKPVNNRDSDYDRGLRLWERRSEGGILADDNRSRERNHREREVDENARMDMIRNRRQAYERRRGGSGRDSYRDNNRRYNSIEDRIRNEGLR